MNALLILYAFYAVVVYFKAAPTAPAVTTDDGLAAVAYAVAEHGRYGYLASPLQPPANVLRHDGFLNYGPFFYFFAAGLFAVFGYSLFLIRTIALLTYGFMIVFGRRILSGEGDQGDHHQQQQGNGWWPAALWAFLLIFCFEWRQIIVARPDVFVGLFAWLMVCAASVAIRRESWRWWAVTGLMASMSAFSHLFAASMVPAAILIVIFAAVMESGGVRRLRWSMLIRNMAGLALGGLTGAFLFVASFKFHISDFLTFVFQYKSHYVVNQSGYLDVLRAHLQAAFNYLKVPVYPIFWVFILVASIGLLWRVRDRREQWSRLLPAVTAFAVLFLALGRNTWVSGYYSPITQFLGFWLWCVLALVLASQRQRVIGTRAVAAVIATFIFAVGIVRLNRMRSEVHPRLQEAQASTPIEEYFYETRRGIPAGAVAWGTIFLGNDTPDRIQLIQVQEAIHLMGKIPKEAQGPFAPEFILWGLNEEREMQVSVFQGAPIASLTLHQVLGFFPGVEYRLVRIVDAPPYRVTRIYRRVGSTGSVDSSGDSAGSDEQGLPDVAVYEPSEKSWAVGIKREVKTAFVPREPVQVRLGYSLSSEARRAKATLSAELPPGHYLIEVIREGSAVRKAAPVYVCVTSKDVIEETIGYNPSSNLDCALTESKAPTKAQAPAKMKAYLIHRHPGGPVFVSEFHDASDSDKEGGKGRGEAMGAGLKIRAWSLENVKARYRKHDPFYTDLLVQATRDGESKR